ncbi:MAG: T9SS type A sorting domain-containing protein [Mariniphaga sp.]
MKKASIFIFTLLVIFSFGAKEAFSQVTESTVPNSMTIGITVTAKPRSATLATKPYDILTVTDANPANKISLSVDPNSIPDNLIIGVGGNPAVQYSTSLYDVSGKLLLESITTGSVTKLSMALFPPSTYLLKVLEGTNEIRTFRIIKN